MRKSERRLTTKLTLNRETARTLLRGELTKVEGGVDSHDPCTATMPLVPPANTLPRG